MHTSNNTAVLSTPGRPLRQIVIGSPMHFLQMYQSNRQLSQLPDLAPLASVMNSNKGCRRCPSNPAFQRVLGQTAAIMYGLPTQTWESIKKILNVDKICYYVRNGGKLDLKCL